MERVNDASCGPSGCYTYQVSRHSTEMLHNLNQQRKNGGRFCDVLLRALRGEPALRGPPGSPPVLSRACPTGLRAPSACHSPSRSQLLCLLSF